MKNRTMAIRLPVALLLAAMLLPDTSLAGAGGDRGARTDWKVDRNIDRNIDPDDEAGHALADYRARGEWMLEQPGQRMRAMGLVLLMSPPLMPPDGEPLIASDGNLGSPVDELLDRMEASIRRTTDPAALQWLGWACSAGDIEAFCRQAGLDSAIVRHDEANLVSRLSLAEEDGLRELVLDSKPGRYYVAEAIETLFQALSLDPATRGLAAYHRVGGSVAIPMMNVLPMHGLAEECTGPQRADPELRAACIELAGSWAAEGNALLLRSIGWSIRRELAAQAGRDEEAARMRAAALFEQAQISCFATHAEDHFLTISDEQAEEWIGLVKAHGEDGAYRKLGKRLGADCSDPPDPIAEFELRQADRLEDGAESDDE